MRTSLNNVLAVRKAAVPAPHNRHLLLATGESRGIPARYRCRIEHRAFMDEPLLHRLAVALGVGLIVGVERGWNTRLEAGGMRPAGLRTFALVALLGGVLAAVGGSGSGSYMVLAAGLLVLGAFTIGV